MLPVAKGNEVRTFGGLIIRLRVCRLQRVVKIRGIVCVGVLMVQSGVSIRVILKHSGYSFNPLSDTGHK